MLLLFQWLSFFDDVMSFLETGEKAAELYLRILVAIDEEVVARNIPHLPQVSQPHCIVNITCSRLMLCWGNCVPSVIISDNQTIFFY